MALLVFLATVMPWLIMATRAEPGFLRYALVDETFLRFTSSARFNRGGSFYYPVLVAGAGLGLWTPVLLATLPLLLRRTGTSAQERIAARFALRTAAAIILFFAVSASKRPGYVLPSSAMIPGATGCILRVC